MHTTIYVDGHAKQILVCARLDNLGKESLGATIQNMNFMPGIDEGTGL